MRSNVTLEKPRSAELLTAVGTLATLVVRSHMHTVRGHRDVHFFAMGTFSGLFVVDASMGLSVTC